MLLFNNHSQTDQKNTSYIKDVTSQNFVTEVLEGSQNKIVLVDFWAPWCGPCKQLTPLLERVVAANDGKVILAKINIDENPEIATQLRVQSVPTVYAFLKGQPVDAFMGVVSEQKLQAFLARLFDMIDIPDDLNLEVTLKQARKAFDRSHYEESSAFYIKILNQIPHQENALAGLAHCYIMVGSPREQTISLLNQIPEDKQKTLEAEALQKHLALIKEIENYLFQENKNNSLEILYRNALQKFVENHPQKAIEELLMLIQNDKDWQDSLAKITLLKIFAALGHSHSLTLENRRKLSAMIFI